MRPLRFVAPIAAVAALLTGAAVLAHVDTAQALPPVGTVTTETVGGFSFQFTYNGPEWVLINWTGAGSGNFKRPNVSSLVMEQSGANTTLAASQCNAANAIEAMIAKYDLDSEGYFVGHSSTASLAAKSIKHHPASNVACADRLVAHLKGVGLSGIAWRVDVGEAKYSSGGKPYGPDPWPANIRHVWWFSGVLHTPVNEYRVGGADENTQGVQTWSMTITEAWHWTAQMWGDPINLPTPIIPTTITSPVVFDHQGPDNHQRVVVTPNEGHVIVSSSIDTDNDFWSTMLTPADGPAPTTTAPTTTTSTTTTTVPSTTTSSTTTTTAPTTTTTSAPPVDPVREALVESVAAAQRALDLYDAAHP